MATLKLKKPFDLDGEQVTEMMTIKCNGCGGINTIQKGAIGECDYCGSSIKGE